MRCLFKSLISSLAAAPIALAQEPVDFSTEVRPILNKNCISCHGGVKKSAGVSFLFREEALATGDSGNPTVIPGDAEGSEMYQRIIATDPKVVMPSPDHGDPLSAEEAELIRRWIDEGAKWGDHWSFEVPERKQLPQVSQPEWPKSRIDHFLLANMEAKGWSPNEPATAAAFLRRITFDLVGLPPTPEELADFESAYAQDPDAAVAAKADELMARPAFGEKWASHWLDLARYADSEGLGVDSRRPMFPYRDWVIRSFNDDLPFDEFTRLQIAGDLIPDAGLDGDIATAFHRMTQSNGEGGTDDEEFRTIAVMDRITTTWETWQGLTFGCVQCHSHPYEPIRHEDYYRFMAFFNNSRDRDLGSHHPRLKIPLDHSKYDQAEQWHNTVRELSQRRVDEIRELRESVKWQKVSSMKVASKSTKAEAQQHDGYAEFRTVGTVARGTTFDLTADPGDLQRLAAVRLDILPLDPEKALRTPEWGAVISHFTLSLIAADGTKTPIEIAEILGDEANPQFADHQSLNGESAEGWGPYSKMFHQRSMVALLKEPIDIPEGAQVHVHMLQRRYDLAAFPIVSKRGRLALTDSPAFHDWAASAERKDYYKRLGQAKGSIRKMRGLSLPVMEELEPALERQTYFFDRGNWLEKKGDDLKPGVPDSLNELVYEGDEPTRANLAEWFVSPENPLTARVAVNRLWEQIFGFGIVLTLEDFGSAGALPTHPALLDDIAVRFREDMGYSTKTLLRELVTSAAYRQDARVSAEAAKEDAYNLFLARGPRNRLSAEMARDNLLAASGQLTEQLYGEQVYPPMPQGGYTPPRAKGDWKTPKKGDPQRYRRAVYTYVRRSSPFPAFAGFDAPSREVCSKRRINSNTPIAALISLNDPVSVESAMAMAKRVDRAHPKDPAAQLALAYELATSKRPNADTAAKLQEFYETLVATYIEKPQLAKELNVSPRLAAMNSVCSVVLNLDEALTR